METNQRHELKGKFFGRKRLLMAIIVIVVVVLVLIGEGFYYYLGGGFDTVLQANQRVLN